MYCPRRNSTVVYVKAHATAELFQEGDLGFRLVPKFDFSEMKSLT